jgi:hypothetical protein
VLIRLVVFLDFGGDGAVSGVRFSSLQIGGWTSVDELCLYHLVVR